MTTKHTSDYSAVVRERTHTGLGPMAQNQGFLSNEVIIFITVCKMSVGAGGALWCSPLATLGYPCLVCRERKL